MYKIKFFEIKRGKYILFSKRWGQFAQGLFSIHSHWYEEKSVGFLTWHIFALNCKGCQSRARHNFLASRQRQRDNVFGASSFTFIKTNQMNKSFGAKRSCHKKYTVTRQQPTSNTNLAWKHCRAQLSREPSSELCYSNSTLSKHMCKA